MDDDKRRVMDRRRMELKDVVENVVVNAECSSR